MYAKVVKEVAPLPEKLTTTFEVTLHDPDEALRDGVPELEDAEVLCLWDGLVDFVNFITEILIEAMQNMNLVATDGNYVLDLVVGKFIVAKQKCLLAHPLKLLCLGRVEGLAHLTHLSSLTPRLMFFVDSQKRVLGLIDHI